MAWSRLCRLAIALPLCWGAPASAEVLRIQSFDEPGSVATAGLEALADELRAASGGEVDIRVIPPRRLAGAADTLDAMASGLIDGHYSSPAYFAARDPAFALLGDTLALYPDPATRDRWYGEGGGLEIARELYARNGARLVGFVHWPEEWLVMLRPASIVADIAGRRIRASRGPVGDLLERLDVELRPMGGRETLAALEAGGIDGADWSTLPANVAAGLYGAGRFAVRARHSMPVTEISVSNAAWERLSPAARRLFEQKVAAFSARQRGAFNAAEARARSEARAGGATLLEFSAASQARLRESALAVFEDWAGRSPAAAAVAAGHRAFLETLGLLAAPQRPAAPRDGSG